MSASTQTRRASTPSIANVSTRARLMTARSGEGRYERAAVQRRTTGTRRHGPAARASERVLEADEGVALVDEDADRVEADALEERRAATLVEPEARDLAHPRLLAPVQVVPRHAAAEPAGLDLREHDRVAVDRDQVELAETGLVVARDDPPAEPLEVLGGQLLAQAAK